MIDVEILRPFFLTLAVSMARILAACSVAPFMGGQLLSGTMRNSLVFSFALILFPATFAAAPQDLDLSLSWIVLIGKEVILGVLLGFMASKAFWLAMSVGFFIDNQRGASMASSMDPMTGEQTSPLGEFLQQTITVLFYSGGGFLVFLGMIYESYKTWPPFDFHPNFNNAFPGLLLQQVDNLMQLAVVIAAPIIITVFISEFGLGLMNRFAPQLQVFFLAMPIKSLVAIIVLIFYMTYLMEFLQDEYLGIRHVMEYMKQVIS